MREGCNTCSQESPSSLWFRMYASSIHLSHPYTDLDPALIPLYFLVEATMTPPTTTRRIWTNIHPFSPERKCGGKRSNGMMNSLLYNVHVLGNAKRRRKWVSKEGKNSDDTFCPVFPVHLLAHSLTHSLTHCAGDRYTGWRRGWVNLCCVHRQALARLLSLVVGTGADAMKNNKSQFTSHKRKRERERGNGRKKRKKEYNNTKVLFLRFF